MRARLAILVACALGTTARADDGVRHVPPAEATAGAAIELVADAEATVPTLAVHFRTTGTTGAFAASELVRRETHWVAVIPATAVVAPGVDYYLEAGGAPVFASAQAPHTMRVEVTEDNARLARDVSRTGGRRSRIHSAVEWVDFGTSTINGQRVPDRYYRIDADFSYRLWAYPLEDLRIGYTRMIGDTLSNDPKDCGTQSMCTAEAGFKVGGWFELGLAPVENVHLDGRLMVLANSAGFGAGTRGEIRLGDREGSHVALGGEFITGSGANGFFRLGWGTVPGLPMAATVEVSQLPDVRRQAGVRLYYDIARGFDNGIRVGLRIGYAARNENIAGFTTGAGASVDF